MPIKNLSVENHINASTSEEDNRIDTFSTASASSDTYRR